VRWHRTSASRTRAVRPTPTLSALAVLTSLGLLLAACSPLGPTTQAQAGPPQPVIQTPAGSTTPTPGPFTYTVGAWPSNYTPAASSTVIIFVSFRDAGAPVAGASATASAYYPGSGGIGAGPVKTDSQGYAAIGMPVRALANTIGTTKQTVQVTVTVSYQGHTYQATTNFTPL
jgi:hypothetical protein